MKSVQEVGALSGVSRRTLQYYDAIGLLPPSAVKESGYRLYDDASLRRLWTILFYKELGLSLSDIRALLESPKEEEKALLRQHRRLLLEKLEKLEKLTASVDRILDGAFELSMLRDFDQNRIEAVKAKYAKEIETIVASGFVGPLVKSGILPDDAPLVENASKIITLNFDRIIALYLRVLQSFPKAMPEGPRSAAAREAVAAFRELISMWIPCDDAVFRRIGQAYLDERAALDEKAPGLAAFVYEAILAAYP